MNYVKVYLKQFSKAIITATVKSTVVIFGVCAIMSSIWVAAIMLSKYPSGRDTVESFGNGRYQIIGFHSFDGKQKQMRYSLRDEKKNISIVEDIYIYNNKDKLGKVYIIGKNSYTILDYKQEKYDQTDNIANFSSDEQDIFNQVDNIEWRRLQ